MKKCLLLMSVLVIALSCNDRTGNNKNDHGLCFNNLPTSWDEAIPLGNGMTGALVWMKEGRLRISFDRADLWDLRPMENIGIKEWNYLWVYEQWKKDNYKEVQELFDAPYDRQAAPTKIPAASIEFDIAGLGDISGVNLDIGKALCTISWDCGVSLEIFVEAKGENGWFRFKGAFSGEPLLIPPSYNIPEVKTSSDMHPYHLSRLGYRKGEVESDSNSIHYVQEGWENFCYSVDVEWNKSKQLTEGCWKISVADNPDSLRVVAKTKNSNLSSGDFEKAFTRHKRWWTDFWKASSVSLPDSILERQWYLELYKFGSAARPDAPPISLQAVWTADNDLLPPWKGDFHHDLNTQLSYWPAYSSNHTDLAEGYLNWMERNRGAFEDYTKEFYGNEGLNVPGVTSLDGKPLGGWIQYSFGPTVSAWLAHHFYLQWIYTNDTLFLKDRAYPWIKDVARHIEAISVKGDNGLRKIPISSSPEFYDNSRDAWFPEMTNFDLALVRWTFEKAAEIASVIGMKEEHLHWQQMLDEWPQLAVDSLTGLMVAPGHPYSFSHRHFSHLMAVYPLGLLDVSGSQTEREIIISSLENLRKHGPDAWTGYSYSWLGCLYARSLRGNEAADALRTFATCFCSVNSFHVNGDQSGTGKSKSTYRPFTLEGNFAFAAGIQEMLLQSHRGVIEVFPAIPDDWTNVSFENLRAIGAVLVSANMHNGRVTEIKMVPQRGGTVKVKVPDGKMKITLPAGYTFEDDTFIFESQPGDVILLKNR